jgi:hypothetical protein
MKRLITPILALGLLGCLSEAIAAPTMRLSADNGLTWVVVVDNGPLDSNPAVGFISYSGPVGDWFANSETGFGEPLIGSATAPIMDVSSQNVSTQAETLIVQLSDTNFVAFPNQTFVASINGFTAGTVTYTSFRDSGNVLFGTTSTYAGDPVGVSPSPTASSLITEGPFNNSSFDGSNAVVVANGTTPYSLTLQTTIIHTSPGQTDTDSLLYSLAPPACNCSLTFNAQQFITNCVGDGIADVSASQSCDGGTTRTPIIANLISAVTNGTGTLIITRNYSAQDTCGDIFPFTQTITINAKPDCTITPSVTTATVGGTGYTASVPNAGVGATYAWSILNGSITAGQNMPTITWSAGTNTNSPISIFVTVTAATGCQSACSASVRLICPPPPFGKGDAATMGFWHNKNGQGLITNAPSGPPTLANWLATTFPCLYGSSAPAGNNLTGKSNADVANLFTTKFNGSAPKTDAQVMSVALASYFTSTSLGGGAGPVKFGFNQSAGGTGVKLYNVGSFGTALGLQNNTSYTILQILQAANNVKCSNQNATLPNDLFNAINTGGDIN